MLGSTLIVVSSMLVIGQAEETSSNYEHLKGLEFYVGEWIGESRVPEDADDPNAGKELKIPVTTKWELNKNLLVADWKVQVDGKTVNQGRWL